MVNDANELYIKIMKKGFECDASTGSVSVDVYVRCSLLERDSSMAMPSCAEGEELAVKTNSEQMRKCCHN
jgi:hypothetical protein